MEQGGCYESWQMEEEADEGWMMISGVSG